MSGTCQMEKVDNLESQRTNVLYKLIKKQCLEDKGNCSLSDTFTLFFCFSPLPSSYPLHICAMYFSKSFLKNN